MSASAQRKDVTISFPQQLTVANLERVLAKHYLQSAGATRIAFNMTNVVWCDILALSIIAMWIQESVQRDIQVEIGMPKDTTQRAFLRAYRFGPILDVVEGLPKTAGRESEDPFATPRDVVPLGPTATYPLTFLDEAAFRILLTRLEDPSVIATLFAGLLDPQVISSGRIRDVVLAEVGDNAFRHAGGSLTNIVMTLHRPSSQKSSLRWLDAIVGAALDPEKTFFQRLSGQPFLSLVIADKGPGIAEKIRAAFGRDMAPEHQEDPSEATLIDYAFLEHSSSRTAEERIGALASALTAGQYVPPTGLFRLRQTLIEHEGMLVVRSGSTILVYDGGSSTPTVPRVLSAIAGRALAPFGGTQLKVYFPLRPAADKSRSKSFAFRHETEHRTRYEHVSVPPLDVHGVDDSDSATLEATVLVQTFEIISRIPQHNAGVTAAVTCVVDMAHASALSQKAVEHLVIGMAQRQTPTMALVGVNAGPSVFDVSAGPDLRSLILRPVLLFGTDLCPRFITASRERDLALEATIVNGAVANIELNESHLFERDRASGSFRCRFTGQSFATEVARLYQVLMSRRTLDDPDVWHPRSRVVIPSASYCEGYLETYRVIASPRTRAHFKTWLLYSLAVYTPDAIIVVNNWMADVVLEALREAGSAAAFRVPRVLRVTIPLKRMDSVRLRIQVKAKERVVVLSDAVGTGRTLREVLVALSHAAETQIWTVFNGLQAPDNLMVEGRLFPVRAVAAVPLTHYDRLPAGWRYDELFQVDATTHLLLPPVEASGTLWSRLAQTETPDFVRDIVIPTGACFELHACSSRGHTPYFFSLPRVIERHATLLSSIIAADVEQKAGPVRGTITHCMYLSTNASLRTLAASLLTYPIAQSATLVPMAEGDESAGTAAQAGAVVDTVVAIVDAAATGTTILDTFSAASRIGARHLLCYVLIKRGHSRELAHVQQIAAYGRVTVQVSFLADVGVPAYAPKACPLCAWLGRLRSACTNRHLPARLESFLKEEVWRYAERPTEALMTAAESAVDGPLDHATSIRLLLRRQVNEAIRSPASRKELLRVVRERSSDRYRFLRLLEVLARERVAILDDAQVRNQVFYETFAQELRDACRQETEQLSGLDGTEVDAVLAVMSAFDEAAVVDTLPQLIEGAGQSEALTSRLLVHCELSSVAMTAPAAVADALRQAIHKAQRPARRPQAVRALLEEALTCWGSREADYATERRDLVRWYRELTSGAFHEAARLISDLRRHIQQQPVPRALINSTWQQLHADLAHALDLTRNLTRSNIQFTGRADLNRSVSDTSLALHEGRRVVHTLAAPSLLDESESFVSLLTSLAAVLTRLDVSVLGTAGLTELLKILRCDAKDVVYNVLAQSERGLARFTVRSDVTHSAAVVFAESSYLWTVVDNLVRNSVKHSTGTRLDVAVTVNQSREEVNVVVADDGCGFGGATRRGGLRLVNRIIGSYGGSVELNDVLPGTDMYVRGLRSAARVTLPALPIVRSTLD